MQQPPPRDYRDIVAVNMEHLPPCRDHKDAVLAPSEKDIESNASITPRPELQERRRVTRPRLFAFVVLIALSSYWAINFVHHGCRFKDHGHHTTETSDSALHKLGQHPIKDGNICLTPACVHASSELLYNLSPDFHNIDPCTDFEELVCGGWRDRHDLRPDQGDAFTGTVMSENSDTLLRHILEGDYPKSSSHSYFSPAALDTEKSSADKDNFKKLKSAYDACLNEDLIKSRGTQPLNDVLDETFEKFTHGDVSSTILFALQSGMNSLVSAGTGADDKDPDTVVVSVSAPWSIGLPAKEMYKDDKIVKQYESTISKVFGNLGLDVLASTELAEKLVAFEKMLAAATPSAEDRNDVTVSTSVPGVHQS
jgi:hypothetical protein